MTPPFSIGDEVEIIGPDLAGKINWLGQKFKIERISGIYDNHYTANGVPLFPASSLRLVEEELKIGDWAEIIKPGLPDYTGQIGKIICIDDADHCGYPYQMENKSWWSAKSLRKLTPEEIQQHTSTIGYQAQKCNAELEKAKEAMREILAPLVDERLSAIESRLNSLAPSHTELMGDVEALAENAGAIEKRLTSIEKRQREQHERMDRFMQDYREHKDFDFDMHDRIKVLEGEMPEVCEPAMTDIGAIAAIASFGPVPGCVAAFIRHETEKAEKRKLVGEPCHRNPKRNCALRNIVNRMDCAICEEVAQRVLDSMREA